jgi:glycosyltransferase involved in cell wall biosynthesis
VFHPEHLVEKISGHQNSKKINYLGLLSREELKHALGKSMAGLVLFHPVENHVNSQPNKLFEYMSAPLPVIASDFPLWEEIIRVYDCGILVDSLNEDEIAATIDFIIQNPADALKMGKRGRNAIELHYNWPIESKTLKDIYNELI